MQTYNSFGELVAGQVTGLVSDMSTFNLDISYASEGIKARCKPGSKTNRKLSEVNQKVLADRLSDIADAPTLEDLRNGKGYFHELQHDREGQLSCTLDKGDRLVFIPDHNPVPVNPRGRLDWSKVTAVKILEIVDYH